MGRTEGPSPHGGRHESILLGIERIQQLWAELEDHLHQPGPPPVQVHAPVRPAARPHGRLGLRESFAAGVGVVAALVSAGLVSAAQVLGEPDTGAPQPLVINEATATATAPAFAPPAGTFPPDLVTPVAPPPDAPAAPALAGAQPTDTWLTVPLLSPFTVTDVFGSTAGRTNPHVGIDLAPFGDRVPVVAACSGTVLAAAYDDSYGNHVVLDCGDGWTTLYAHLSELNVGAGTPAVQGQTVLGLTGSTGHSTGEHLHFELAVHGIPVDPAAHLAFGKLPPALPGPTSTPTTSPTATTSPTSTASPSPTGSATPSDTPDSGASTPGTGASTPGTGTSTAQPGTSTPGTGTSTAQPGTSTPETPPSSPASGSPADEATQPTTSTPDEPAGSGITDASPAEGKPSIYTPEPSGS